MSKELELTSESSKAARAAASWVVRLHSDQAVQADYEAFESWRNETPVNAAEYDAHQKLWHAARALAKNPEARSILLRPQEQPRPISRRALFGGLGLAAAVTTVMLIPRRAASQTFRSARGERRNIALEEGTSLILNTESELRVELREHERRLYLDNGQCLLKVA